MNLVRNFGFVVALLVVSCSALAGDMKVGLVDKQVLGQDSLYAKTVAEKINKDFTGRRDTIIAKEKDLRSKFEALERDRDVLSETDRVAKEREISKMQQSLQEEGATFQEDFARRQEKENAAFDKIVNEVLTDIAKEEKLDLILSQQVALFNGRKADYTYKALQQLDKKYKETKK